MLKFVLFLPGSPWFLVMCCLCLSTTSLIVSILYYSFSCVSCLPCLKYLPPVPSSSPCLTGPSALCAYNLICVFVRVSVCTSRVSQRSLCSCFSFLFCFTFFFFGLCTSLDFCNSQIKDPLSLQFTWSGILSCLVNLWQSEGRLSLDSELWFLLIIMVLFNRLLLVLAYPAHSPQFTDYYNVWGPQRKWYVFMLLFGYTAQTN